MPQHKRPKRDGNSDTVIGCDVDYSDEEREFLQAMDRYKREKKRPFPTWSEALAVLRELGYRKVGEEESQK